MRSGSKCWIEREGRREPLKREKYEDRAHRTDADKGQGVA